MRITALTLSLTIAFCGGVVARADEDDEAETLQLTQYNTPWDGTADASNAVDFVDDAGPVTGGQVVTPRTWFEPPAYSTYFQADALWLARIHDVDRTLFVELPPASTTALTTGNAGLADKFRLGAMFTLGINFDQVSSFEGTYFGLNQWQSHAQVFNPNGSLGLAGTLQLRSEEHTSELQSR